MAWKQSRLNFAFRSVPFFYGSRYVCMHFLFIAANSEYASAFVANPVKTTPLHSTCVGYICAAYSRVLNRRFSFFFSPFFSVIDFEILQCHTDFTFRCCQNLQNFQSPCTCIALWCRQAGVEKCHVDCILNQRIGYRFGWQCWRAVDSNLRCFTKQWWKLHVRTKLRKQQHPTSIFPFRKISFLLVGIRFLQFNQHLKSKKTTGISLSLLSSPPHCLSSPPLSLSFSFAVSGKYTEKWNELAGTLCRAKYCGRISTNFIRTENHLP